MKFFNKILIILVVFSLYQCNNQDKAKQKSTTFQKQQNKKPIVKKAWDSLNRSNTEAFFNEYSKKNKESIVLIKTEFGNIKLRLFEDVPIHKANFIFLTKIKYFDTTVFYRVAKNFVIQGGNSDEMYTQKQRRKHGNYLLKPEFRTHRTHKYGALAAAREWEDNPNKLSSPFEFYIVHSKKGAHHLDNEDTVFGEVISGFDTMDKISKVKVGIDEWPLEDIKMKIEVLE